MDTVELYGGEVKMQFDPYWHNYYITDEKNGVIAKKVTSVTTALKIIDKPSIRRWAVNVSVDTAKELIKPGVVYDELMLASIFDKARKANTQAMSDAGDAGTLLHRWVEAYIKGENPPIPINPMLRESCKKFLTWVHKYNVKFLLSEQPVYSRKYFYTGTLDFICQINGLLYIGDLKTSKGIYLEQMMQTTPYRHAREEEYPNEKYHGQLICRIGKDGSFEYKLLDDRQYPGLYKKMFNCFLFFLKAGELYHQLEQETK